jgi:uncharacterized protein (DUF2249 family)
MSALHVDLRPVDPQLHESTLSSALKRLPAGGALELISDSEPGHLRPQLHLEPSLALTWGEQRKEDGAWRVRIVKTDAAGCCGGCARE